MNNTKLPPFLMTSEKGTFARKTIEERKPKIIKQILTDFDYTPDIRQSLIDFKNEIATGLIKQLQDNASDCKVWQQELKPWMGKSWFEIPWMLAEAYFYRRVLEITHYFQPGPYMGIDPFQRLKTQEMLEGQSVFEDIYPSMTKISASEGFKEFCVKALWGNRGDLSHTDALDPSMETQSHRIILDETDQAFKYLTLSQPAAIAYFFDNVGKELFFDLAFIDFLVTTGFASKVTCYLKNQPFFVSDAMPKDLFKTIDLMMVSENPEIQQLSQRLLHGIRAERIRIEAPSFLTQPKMFRKLPEVFQEEIAGHDITILKGDVNYRRLVGDRHWEPTTPVEVAGGYFPTNFLSLRTLKAELVVGLTDEILAKVKSEADPEWLTNGKRGLITFYQK
jgi:uncharacterized protein with ATP-grasp and redox domains